MSNRKMDPRRRKRIGLYSILLTLGLAFALPLGSYGLHWLGQSAQAQEVVTGGITGDTNPRSNYWRAVGEGVAGYSAVKGDAANVLVQRSGTAWQQFRNGTVAKVLPWAIVAMAVILLLYHLIVGRQTLDHPRSGRIVPRWSWINRLLHWTTAVSFIALAVTGLSMLIGRELLIPVLGKAGFATWAGASIQVHNVVGPVFSVCIALMIVFWIWSNIPTRVDWQWLKAGGGLFSKSSSHGSHPSAGRFNAGEKLWFWLLVLGGGAVVLTGLVLVSPSYASLLPAEIVARLAFLQRPEFQQASIIHAVIAVLWTAVALGHIYIGTAGTEGAFEGMATGYVSEEWARQHHDLWYEKMASRGKILSPGDRAPASEASTRTLGAS